MDARKLIGFGNSNAITLPSDWVKKNKLKKGDEIYLREEKDAIILSKKSSDKHDLRFITIVAENKNIHYLKTEIIAAYLSNYDVIEIIDHKKDSLAKIKPILHNLSGVEIIEETATKIVVKYLIDIKELSIEGLIRRIDVVIRSMVDDMVLSVNEDNWASIYERDENINRLSLLAHRTIRYALENPDAAREFRLSTLDLLNAFDTVNNLEKIADHTKRISRMLCEGGITKKTKTELERLLQKLRERYLKTMKVYYGLNKTLAYELEAETKDLAKEFNKYLSKKYETEAIRMVEFCKGFVAQTKWLARVVIDRSR